MELVLITGNTYPVKDQIKDLGGRWDATAKGWRVPSDKAPQAQLLVSGAGLAGGGNRTSNGGKSNSKTCYECGHTERRNARGYPVGDRVWGGLCQSCREERDMGY